MLITNLEKGENYNLSPDTQIQVERTNPFFNNYGEQTTPLSLPASEKTGVCSASPTPSDGARKCHPSMSPSPTANISHSAAR